MYGGHNPTQCSYVGRPYIPIIDGGRGLVSVKDCVEEDKCNLVAVRSKEGLVDTAAAELNMEKDNQGFPMGAEWADSHC